MLLCLSELGDDFGPAAFGAFLLRDSIIGACQAGLGAVPTWMTAIATDLLQQC